jgi:anti-sigma regulatory factor (Ser/Thr protein kinase)
MTRRSALHQAFLGDERTPGRVRRALGAWLRERDVSDDHRENLVLAVNEAVTNVVDHAYRDTGACGQLEVDVELDDSDEGERWVTIVVTDHGVWRAARAGNGFRGRGLQMIDACTDWQSIERRSTGTRVTMARRVN